MWEEEKEKNWNHKIIAQERFFGNEAQPELECFVKVSWNWKLNITEED